LGVDLPTFPVDDATLDLLARAIDPWSHGDREATTSSVWPLLQMMSEMAGADVNAIEYVTRSGIRMMRDPMYHDHDVMKALIIEIRRLRAALRDAQENTAALVDELGDMRCRVSAAEADLDEARKADGSGSR
jgi:hypothetical protein